MAPVPQKTPPLLRLADTPVAATRPLSPRRHTPPPARTAAPAPSARPAPATLASPLPNPFATPVSNPTAPPLSGPLAAAFHAARRDKAAAPSRSPLRLTTDTPAPGRPAPNAPAPRPTKAARAAVAQANLLASGMSPLDGRWIMALRVAQALEGGTAAILRPDRRDELLKGALALGLRPFDANLVIAIVQDGRRHGLGGLTVDVEERLRLLPAPEPVAPHEPIWPMLFAAALMAGVIALGLAEWLVGR